MPDVAVGKKTSCNIDIYYKDRSSGQSGVFSHGWPLSAGALEYQTVAR